MTWLTAREKITPVRTDRSTTDEHTPAGDRVSALPPTDGIALYQSGILRDFRGGAVRSRRAISAAITMLDATALATLRSLF
jgi:hypothetical protein